MEANCHTREGQASHCHGNVLTQFRTSCTACKIADRHTQNQEGTPALGKSVKLPDLLKSYFGEYVLKYSHS